MLGERSVIEHGICDAGTFGSYWLVRDSLFMFFSFFMKFMIR